MPIPFHKKEHPLAGKAVRLVSWMYFPEKKLGGTLVTIVDWFDRLHNGKPWIDFGSLPMVKIYHDRMMASIQSRKGWPLDDEVVVVSLEDGERIVIHVQEIEDA